MALADALACLGADPGFSALDRRFARFVAEAAAGGDDALPLAAARVSRALAKGAVFVELAELAGLPGWPGLRLPKGVEGWQESLAASPAVQCQSPQGGKAAALACEPSLCLEGDNEGAGEEAGAEGKQGDGGKAGGQGNQDKQDGLARESQENANGDAAPLVLAGTRLYLRRYWVAQAAGRADIARRLARRLPAPPAALLDALFPEGGEQKAACALCAASAFAILEGGPGTGKTTTVLKLLALLLGQAGKPLEIRLAAPTGKAAARLAEALQTAKKTLPEGIALDAEALACLPQSASTVHRLLEAKEDGSFGRTAANPLALDVLAIDEASMLDVRLFAALCDALPPDARLFLLGDADQLSCVEPGAVFGELCKDPALQAQVAHLRKSWRFSAHSGIGELAFAINQGDAGQALAILQDPAFADVRLVDEAALAAETDAFWRGSLKAIEQERPKGDAGQAAWDAWAAKALARLGQFQLLCAVREGPFGVEAQNRAIEKRLRHSRLAPQSPWFAGRPVIATRNDYRLGIMNGDMGIALPFAEGLAVAFADAGAPFGIRRIAPARLALAESAFALTVHKAQGSEFERIALLLPERMAHESRALIYTALTRAKAHADICAPGAPPGHPGLGLV